MCCKFCEYWKKTGKEPIKEEIFKLLNDAREFGIGVYNAWTVEPLLRKDLPQIMAYAKGIGMITSMVTNGKLLYERAEELGDVDYLSVSVDGIKSYKEIRRMDFETLLKGLKKAIEGAYRWERRWTAPPRRASPAAGCLGPPRCGTRICGC